MVLGEQAWADYPNVKRLVDEVSARPAAARVAALRDRYKFKTEMDEESRRNLFPGMKPATTAA
jgi:GST-like protein